MSSTELVIDRRELRFALREWLQVEQLSKHEPFAAFDAETVDLMLEEAANFATEVVGPTRQETDRVGSTLEDGRVRVPQCMHEPYRQAYELGWGAITGDPEYGGQGAPSTVGLAVNEGMIGGNQALSSFFGLTEGCARLILSFGTDDLKRRYVPHMHSGRFNGTMCLSEPQAGSDVGASTTRAEPLGDGRYRISGTKVWISNGDADLVENTIHAVLARVPGAAAGTGGLSLFLVPRVHVNDDGSLGEFNDVHVGSIEHKMGLHGSPTCVLNFGEAGSCVGWLLGQENKGMSQMFQMMNEERLATAGLGLGLGSAAYQNALTYAHERKQGTHITQMRVPEAPKVSIVEHPAVRFNLMQMKSRVEAMRALLYGTTFAFDQAHVADTPQERQAHLDLVELLTPMCKGYCTETGIEVVNTGIQVLGGVGYTQDFPLEQLFRDARVTAIYEGTTDIQALDLVGRKMVMNNGALFLGLLNRFGEFIGQHAAHPRLGPLCSAWEEHCSTLSDLALGAREAVQERGMEAVALYATPFLLFASAVTASWFLLQQAAVASGQLDTLLEGHSEEEQATLLREHEEARFYDSKLKTVNFFLEVVVPQYAGALSGAQKRNYSALDIIL
ncbi:MAG: acyl-CoA dehydrogenase [bacterium]